MIRHFLLMALSMVWLGLSYLPVVEGEMKPHLRTLKYYPERTWCANRPGFLPSTTYYLLSDRIKRFLVESPEIYQRPETLEVALGNLDLYLESVLHEFPNVPNIWRHRSGMFRLLGPIKNPLQLESSLNAKLKFSSSISYFKDSFDMMLFRAKPVNRVGEKEVPVTLRCTQLQGDVYISILDVVRIIHDMSSWAKEKSCGSGLFAVLDHDHNEMQVNIGSSICILTHSSRTEDVVVPKWPLSPHSLLNDHDCKCHSSTEALRAIDSQATTSLEELFREAVVRPLSGQNITKFLEGFTEFTGKYILSYAGSGPAVSISPPELPIRNKGSRTELLCTNFWWDKVDPFPQYFASRVPEQDTPGFGLDGLIALIKYIEVYHQQARCINSVTCVLDLIHEKLPKELGPAICVLHNNPALEYAQVERGRHSRIVEWIERTSESEPQRGSEYSEYQKALEERRQLTSMGHVRHAPIYRPGRPFSGSGFGSNPNPEPRHRSGTNPNAAGFHRAATHDNSATRIYSGLGSFKPLSILTNPQRQGSKALKSALSPPSPK